MPSCDVIAAWIGSRIWSSYSSRVIVPDARQPTVFGGRSVLYADRAAAAVLVVFLMLAINSYLAAYALGIFKISHGKLGPTEIRLVLIVGNLALLYTAHTRLFGHRFLLFDVGGVVGIVVMATMLVYSSIKNTHTLYDLERLPKV